MKIYVAGHRGMVGGAILRRLEAQRDAGADLTLLTRTSGDLDLRDQAQVRAFFEAEQPDQVILAAAKVGGIIANNTYPGQFIYENLMIQCNVIHAAHATGVQKLLQLGSSCIYPKMADQPMAEDALLTGTLEPTNEPYAIAKIAGIKLCESYNRQYGRDYRSVMPTNLYGPGDNFHPENSHVLPALIRRFHDLDKETYDRETEPMLSHINVGSGTDVTIRELAETVARVTGFTGTLSFDATKPDGTPRKLMDVSRLDRLGWRARVALDQGIEETYQWFLAQGMDQLRAK